MSSLHPPFITSFRERLEIRDAAGALQGYLSRYGVWTWDVHRSKYQCTDTGDDLDALRQRHGVPLERVFPIPFNESAP